MPTGTGDKVLLYLDNSNIYFGTQLYAGKLKNFKEGISDVNCRMRLEDLINIVLANRVPDIQKAYGRMTNELCELLKKQGFEVCQSSISSYSSREKEADTQLMADAVEDVIIKRPNDKKPHGGTVVLMSGDQDMCPLIKKARKYGWNVEIWAYASNLASTIKTEAERKEDGTMVIIKSQEMEAKFQTFTHIVRKEWSAPIPANRTILIVFKNGKEWIPDLNEESKLEIETAVIELGQSVFQLPLATKFLLGLDSRDKNVGLAAIVMLPETTKNGYQNYNFHYDILNRREDLAALLRPAMKQRFGGAKAGDLKVIKYSDQGESLSSRGNRRYSNVDTTATSIDTSRTTARSASTSRFGLRPTYPAPSHNQSETKSSYCKFKDTCKHGSSCKYAHSKQQLKCFHCGKAGDHEAKKCQERNNFP